MNKAIDQDERLEWSSIVDRGVRRLLVDSGLKLKDVYTELGISRQTYADKMKGKSSLEMPEIARIAHIFGKTAWELLTIGDPSNRLVDVIVRLREMGIYQGELFEMVPQVCAA